MIVGKVEGALSHGDNVVGCADQRMLHRLDPLHVLLAHPRLQHLNHRVGASLFGL